MVELASPMVVEWRKFYMTLAAVPATEDCLAIR
jgi:hypothetical protein